MSSTRVWVALWGVGILLSGLLCVMPARADTWIDETAAFIGPIKSQTLACFPYVKTRTTIGIGEEVLCKVEPATWDDEDYNVIEYYSEEDTMGTCAWWKTGGAASYTSLSSVTGTETTFTASLSPGGLTIGVTIQDSGTRFVEELIRTKAFTLIPPNGAMYEKTSDCPPWTPWTSGDKYLGAQTYYLLTILPTSVSFYNVNMRENFGSGESGTWPDGSAWHGPTGTVGPMQPTDANHLNDDQGAYPTDGDKLYDGDEWVDFSLAFSVPLEYQNAYGSYVLFHTATAKRRYLYGSMTTQVEVGNVTGSYQGPFQEP